jgi:hypothetical protein
MWLHGVSKVWRSFTGRVSYCCQMAEEDEENKDARVCKITETSNQSIACQLGDSGSCNTIELTESYRAYQSCSALLCQRSTRLLVGQMLPSSLALLPVKASNTRGGKACTWGCFPPSINPDVCSYPHKIQRERGFRDRTFAMEDPRCVLTKQSDSISQRDTPVAHHHRRPVHP